MKRQNNSYMSQNISPTSVRHIEKKRLGDRTLFSHTVDGKRYFSSLDAEIFIGERYIDEVVQINWNIEQATMPLFGYNSYTFDDIAIGARQIPGTFVVNFTKSGFMYDVLRSVQAVPRTTFKTAQEEDFKVEWSSHFEKEHSASWDKSFNIRVGYGDYTMKGVHTTMIVLHCVQITGCQQVLSVDGGVIGEAYSFIAKDIRYEMESLPELPAEKPGDNENDIPDINEFAFSINNISIEKVKMAEGEMGPENPDWHINMSHTSNGGVIDNVVCYIQDDRGHAINSDVGVELGKNTTVFQKIPSKYTGAINTAIKRQANLGTSEENMYMFIEVYVYHSIDGVTQKPYRKKGIKAKVVN